MNLLHHFVDVDSVALLPGLFCAFSSFNGGLSDGLLGALLGADFAGSGMTMMILTVPMTIMSLTDAFIDSPMLIFKEIRSLLIACFYRLNP